MHLLVNIAHGTAHLKLHIELGSVALLFVIVVIIVCPLLAALLLWTSQQRFGLILLALSMAASLIFAMYNHFLAIGPDRVGQQASSPWAIAFAHHRLPAVSCGRRWDLHRCALPLGTVIAYGSSSQSLSEGHFENATKTSSCQVRLSS